MHNATTNKKNLESLFFTPTELLKIRKDGYKTGRDQSYEWTIAAQNPDQKFNIPEEFGSIDATVKILSSNHRQKGVRNPTIIETNKGNFISNSYSDFFRNPDKYHKTTALEYNDKNKKLSLDYVRAEYAEIAATLAINTFYGKGQQTLRIALPGNFISSLNLNQQADLKLGIVQIFLEIAQQHDTAVRFEIYGADANLVDKAAKLTQTMPNSQRYNLTEEQIKSINDDFNAGKEASISPSLLTFAPKKADIFELPKDQSERNRIFIGTNSNPKTLSGNGLFFHGGKSLEEKVIDKHPFIHLIEEIAQFIFGKTKNKQNKITSFKIKHPGGNAKFEVSEITNDKNKANNSIGKDEKYPYEPEINKNVRQTKKSKLNQTTLITQHTGAIYDANNPRLQKMDDKSVKENPKNTSTKRTSCEEGLKQQQKQSSQKRNDVITNILANELNIKDNNLTDKYKAFATNYEAYHAISFAPVKESFDKKCIEMNFLTYQQAQSPVWIGYTRINMSFDTNQKNIDGILEVRDLLQNNGFKVKDANNPSYNNCIYIENEDFEEAKKFLERQSYKLESNFVREKTMSI